MISILHRTFHRGGVYKKLFQSGLTYETCSINAANLKFSPIFLRTTSSGGSGDGSRDFAAEEEDRSFYADDDEDLYPPVIPPLYERGFPAVKYERQNKADFVKKLPTAQEKVDHINPYERDWTWAERRRWRHGPDAPLHAPRKAYFVPSAPRSYNLLPFYKHITRTHTIQGLPTLYNRINVDKQAEIVSKALEADLESELHLLRGRGSEHPGYPVNAILDLLVQNVFQQFSSEYQHLRTAQVSRNVRTESFWIRGGFHTLYNQEKWTDPSKRSSLLRRMVADDRRKIGELAMYCSDKPALQIRTELPLPEFVPITDRLCDTKVEDYVYSPKVMGLFQSEDILWMAPGFELDTGDPCEFGHLTLSDSTSVYEKVDFQECEKDENELAESLLSMGIVTAFNWLNGQAHAQGFNQYNDMIYPLVSQAILSNGKSFFFVTYQLNTLSALMSHWENNEKPCNLCWFSGPVDLYTTDPAERILDWNRDVIKLCLKFFLNSPRKRDYEMKPYIEKQEEVTVAEPDNLVL